MADITAAGVAVVVEKRSRAVGQARNRVRISFGNGVDTYPTGGIPMPSKFSFALPHNLDFLNILDDANPDGLIYKYDRTNQKVRIYFPTQQTGAAGNRAGLELTGGTSVPAATTLVAEAVGF